MLRNLAEETLLRAYKKAPRTLPDSREVFRRHQGGTQDAPRGTQETPRGSQEAPRRHPEPPSEPANK